MPSLTGANSAPGSNFFERQGQNIHLIMKTGSIYKLTVKATLILELDVITELTEDEFYDNGNIALNIAALLGISPNKIKMVNVVRETHEDRRKRRAASGLHYIEHSRVARQAEESSLTLEFSIGTGVDPEFSETVGEADDLEESQEDVAQLNTYGAQLAKLSTSDGDPLGEAVKAGVQEQFPEVEVEVAKTAVGMAEKIKEEDSLPEWFDAENPTGENGTIMAQLGIDESAIQNEEVDQCEITDDSDVCDETGGTVDFSILAALVSNATNGEMVLEELETADERATKQQEELDAAAATVEYSTPTRLAIHSVPTGVQFDGSPMTEPIVVAMFDENDEQMTVVGFAAEPDSVTVRLADDEIGTLNGTLTVPFSPATGLATFNDLVLNGTDNSVVFVVSVSEVYPDIEDQSSTEIPFMAFNGDSCANGNEAELFNLREMWSGDCTNVCTASCGKLADSTDPPVCIEREADCGEFSACGGSGLVRSLILLIDP